MRILRSCGLLGCLVKMLPWSVAGLIRSTSRILPDNPQVGLGRIAVLTVCGLASLSAADGAEFAIPPKFEDVGTFHEGVAPAKLQGQWGLVDRSGNWIVPPSYDQIRRGNLGRFAVLKNKRWGFVTSLGKRIAEPQYDDVSGFRNGLAAVKRGSRWGYLGIDGRAAMPMQFDVATPPENGVATVKKDGQWGYVRVDGTFTAMQDTGGEVLSLSEFTNGFAIRGYKGSEDFYCLSLSETCTNVAQRSFKRVRRFSENFAAVQVLESAKWSYLRADGALLFVDRFEEADDFSQGFAAVRSNGKWGYINQRGTFVVEPRYDAAYSFRDGYAVIRQGQARGFLGLTENGSITIAIPPQYEDVYGVAEGMAGAKSGGKWGFLALGTPPKIVRGVVDLASP